MFRPAPHRCVFIWSVTFVVPRSRSANPAPERDVAFSNVEKVFFPKTSAWDNLQKSLGDQFSQTVWEHLAGTVSEPFTLGDKKRIAVKAIDERGNELMVVKAAEEGR